MILLLSLLTMDDPDSLVVFMLFLMIIFNRVTVSARFSESLTMVSYLINCYYYSIVNTAQGILTRHSDYYENVGSNLRGNVR